MKNILILLLSATLFSGCSTVPEYPISGTYAKINEMQILDPMAPDNNNGIVNELDGNYGKKAMNAYKESTYTSKEGRTNTSAKEVGN
ncbi:hypothetical protein QWY77_02990 [Thalassotalea ponticola]|uniref:hypothetical protein n=1 Tax=Thalassotalea ponticola TaxID=1523392 RepID=UPI0025B5FB0F|nr:hypothetical protein [Thalassotalea ponticola]MDN3651730.1 hypothetical protein [Thalassotalea ponticola]